MSSPCLRIPATRFIEGDQGIYNAPSVFHSQLRAAGSQRLGESLTGPLKGHGLQHHHINSKPASYQPKIKLATPFKRTLSPFISSQKQPEGGRAPFNGALRRSRLRAQHDHNNSTPALYQPQEEPQSPSKEPSLFRSALRLGCLYQGLEQTLNFGQREWERQASKRHRLVQGSIANPMVPGPQQHAHVCIDMQ